MSRVLKNKEGNTIERERYGVELILDLHGCDATTFTRDNITAYFERLCELIDMQREALHF